MNLSSKVLAKRSYQKMPDNCIIVLFASDFNLVLFITGRPFTQHFTYCTFKATPSPKELTVHLQSGSASKVLIVYSY